MRQHRSLNLEGIDRWGLRDYGFPYPPTTMPARDVTPDSIWPKQLHPQLDVNHNHNNATQYNATNTKPIPLKFKWPGERSAPTW